MNQTRFYQRVELRDQDSKGETSLVNTATLFCTEALKHKFDRFAEKATNSEDIRLQELEERQAFKSLLSEESAVAFGGLANGCIKALSSASGVRGRTSSNGPSSSHPTSTQGRSKKQSLAKPVSVMRYRVLRSRESEGSACLCRVTCQNVLLRIAACCKEIVSSHVVSQGSDTVRMFCDVLGRHTMFSTFASLACAISNSARAVDLLCP